jgi:hypothetical protein
MVFTCLTTEITDSLVNSNGEWTKPNTITSRAGVLYLQLVKRITIWSDFNRVDTFITLDTLRIEPLKVIYSINQKSPVKILIISSKVLIRLRPFSAARSKNSLLSSGFFMRFCISKSTNEMA